MIDFDDLDGIMLRPRAIGSGLVLGFIALLLLFGKTKNTLNHPVWGMIFLLFFLVTMWVFISCDVYTHAERLIRDKLLEPVPALRVRSPYSYLLMLVFVLPAFCILGSFVFRLIAAIRSGNSGDMEEELLLWLSVLDALLESSELLNSIVTSVNEGWGIIISITYSMVVILLATVLVSIPAKLLAGAFTCTKVGRITVGFAMLIYVMYLPGWIMSLLDGSFLDMNGVQRLLYAIDHSGGFMLFLEYLLLSLIAALFCSHVFWTLIQTLGFLLVLGIATLIFPALQSWTSNSIVVNVFVLGVCAFVIGKEIWTLVPSTHRAP